MEIDGTSGPKELAEYAPKSVPAHLAREVPQQKTTAESGDGEESWLTSFLSLKGREIFCKVDEEFMLDEFNLKGLAKYVPNLRRVIYYILSIETSESEDDEMVESEKEMNKFAETIYGLIHARYIQTPKGMKQMLLRYQKGVFGTCPRVLCEHQPLLPLGQSDVPRVSPIRFYCPRCQDVYLPQKARHESIDGAYFGPSFAHMFVVNYPLLFIKPKQNFVGTVYGFKVHKTSKNHPPKMEFDPASAIMKNVPRPLPEFVESAEGLKVGRKFITNMGEFSAK